MSKDCLNLPHQEVYEKASLSKDLKRISKVNRTHSVCQFVYGCTLTRTCHIFKIMDKYDTVTYLVYDLPLQAGMSVAANHNLNQ